MSNATIKVNPRVLGLRDSLETVVNMLASRKIKVTQRGMQAHVQWDPKTLQPVSVNVPYLPDDASDTLIDAVQGFVDHEVGHLLYTDPAWTVEASKLDKEVDSLRNCIEDPRIEKAVSRHFKGSAFNLANTSRFVQKEWLEPALQAAVASGDADQAAATLLMPMIRALAGQAEWIQFMDDKWKHVQSIVDKLPQDVVDDLQNVGSSEEAFRIAQRLHEVIKRPKPPEPPPPPPNPENPPEEPGEEQGEGGGQPDEQPGEQPSGEQPPGGQGEKPEPGEPEPEPGQGQCAPAEPGEGEPESGEGPEDPGDPNDGNDHAPESSPLDIDRVMQISRELADYDEALSEAISARAMNEAQNSNYLIFTSDEDTVEQVVPSQRAFDQIPTMEADVDGIVGPLARELERLIIAKSAAFWTGGHRSGKLHGASLHRLRVGRNDVFRQKHDATTKHVAVMAVMDASGSMHSFGSGKIKVASYSAYALVSMLDRLGIPNECIAFTTKPFSPDCLQQLFNDPMRHEYCRAAALRIPVLKTFDERVTALTKARFIEITSGDSIEGHSNVDGESILIGLRRLLARKESRKIMLVLSDGRPAAAGGKGLDQHLMSAVKTVEKAGVEIFGIGICDDSPKKFYPRNAVIKSVNELPTVMLGELKRFLVGL